MQTVLILPCQKFCIQRERIFQFDSDFYFRSNDDKVAEKFKGATSSYAKLYVDEIPVICYDDTIFGGADDVFVLTNFSQVAIRKFFVNLRGKFVGEKISLRSEFGAGFFVIMIENF